MACQSVVVSSWSTPYHSAGVREFVLTELHFGGYSLWMSGHRCELKESGKIRDRNL